MRRTFLILTVLIALQPLAGQMQQEVERIASEYDLAGLSVVALCDGVIAGEWYTGLRDVKRELPVNRETKYRIASISKLVLTTAMLTLCDEGLLDLDADAGDYLGFRLRNPAHPDEPITVRMLLLHTGSIHEGEGYNAFLMATYNHVSDPPSFSELLTPGGEYHTEDMWLDNAPGEYYSYCNANYGLAGTIIERVTGEQFEEFMQQRLLRPLGISASYIPEGVEDIENLAAIYQKREGVWRAQADEFGGVMSEPRDFSGYITGHNGAVFSPQGGLRISAAGLARVMVLHMNEGTYEGRPIVSAESIRLMHTAEWKDNDETGDREGYSSGGRGVGTAILPYPLPGELLPEDAHIVGHSGSAYGLISGFYLDPAKRYGFIYITNGVGTRLINGESEIFYTFQEALIKALRDNDVLSCTKKPR